MATRSLYSMKLSKQSRRFVTTSLKTLRIVLSIADIRANFHPVPRRTL